MLQFTVQQVFYYDFSSACNLHFEIGLLSLQRDIEELQGKNTQSIEVPNNNTNGISIVFPL